MKRAEGLKILTRCEDMNGDHWHGGLKYDLEHCPTCKGTNDAGHLLVPCSPYGRTSADVAPVAWRYAYIVAKITEDPIITEDDLDYAMSLVVNDSDRVREIIREYGHRMYR